MDYTGIRVSTLNNIIIDSPVGVVTGESSLLKADTDYIIQFKIINYSNISTLNHLVSIKDGVSTLITHGININDFKVVNTFEDENMIKEERLCYVKFKPTVNGKYRFGICRTLTNSDKPNTRLFDIREVSCERGTMLQDFKDNYQDINYFIKKTETFFEQTDKKMLLIAKQEDINKSNAQIEILSNNINLKVSRNDVISSINLSPEEVTIQAEKIDMTGNMDLNGTFKCYRNGSNKTGHYLYQSAAMHRGYLEGQENPTFSSGIWSPDGMNDMGYVSVGWTNSDHIDENGCLWMSPIAGGGGELIFSKLLRPNVADISGIKYHTSGCVDYIASISALNDNDATIGHQFDCGVATNSYFRGEGIYSFGNVFTVSFADQPHHLYAVNFQNEGYVYPNGNTQLGTSLNPFYQLVCTHAPQVVSDERKKENIHYIDSPTMILPANDHENITKDDMYNFIKDDLRLATYQLINNREEHSDKVDIGFMVQDIQDSKVGKYIVNVSDEDNYTYDMANRMSVLEGALQKAIEKIEELEQRILNGNE